MKSLIKENSEHEKRCAYDCNNSDEKLSDEYTLHT